MSDVASILLNPKTVDPLHVLATRCLQNATHAGEVLLLVHQGPW